MGKIVTIYLSDSESTELKGFCDENQCTQYSALKTAIRELLSRPIHKRARACSSLIIQVAAVQAAVKKVGLILIKNHLETCIIQAGNPVSMRQSIKT